MASWTDLPLELRLDLLKRRTADARRRWFQRRKIRIGILLRFPYGRHDGGYMYRYVLGTPLGFFMWYSYWQRLDGPHRCQHVVVLDWGRAGQRYQHHHLLYAGSSTSAPVASDSGND